jgi:hypothetical protein
MVKDVKKARSLDIAGLAGLFRYCFGLLWIIRWWAVLGSNQWLPPCEGTTQVPSSGASRASYIVFGYFLAIVGRK